MFAQRTVDRSSLLLKAIAVFLIAVVLLAFVFPSNSSFAQACLEWVAKLAIGIPIWFAVEFAGTKFLGLPFFASLSSQARVAAVAAIAALVIFVVIFGVGFVKHG